MRQATRREVGFPSACGSPESPSRDLLPERKTICQDGDVIEILHPAVQGTKLNHRVQLFRNGGFLAIGLNTRCRHVQKRRVHDIFGLGPNGIADADIHLKGYSDIAHIRQEFDPVPLIFPFHRGSVPRSCFWPRRTVRPVPLGFGLSSRRPCGSMRQIHLLVPSRSRSLVVRALCLSTTQTAWLLSSRSVQRTPISRAYRATCSNAYLLRTGVKSWALSGSRLSRR